jgi:hypothetical protein
MPCTPRDPFVISVDTPGGQIVTAETNNSSPQFKSAGESPAEAKDAPDTAISAAQQDKDSIRALEDMIGRLEKKRQDMVDSMGNRVDGESGKTQDTDDDFPDFF